MKQSISKNLIMRCEMLFHTQADNLLKTKKLKQAYLDDYINKLAQGEEFSYIRFKGGEKADVEILRILLFIKEKADNELHRQEAEQLINELGIISKATETALDPNKSITFFTIGSFYEIYGDEAEFMADKFDLTLTKNKATSREFVGISHYAIDKYKTALESIGIHITVVDESVVPNVVDKSLLQQQVARTAIAHIAECEDDLEM